MAVRRKHIRTLALGLLEKHGIEKAPVEVEKLALMLGVNVQYEPADDNLSGFLLRDFNRHQVLIGVNKNHHTHRQRFTIAHELGHLLLHEGEKLHVDHRYQIKLRDENASKGDSEEEKEANLFAAELLMPVSFIEQDLAQFDALDLSGDENLETLAQKYEVSIQALTFRLAYLNYIQL